MLQAKNSRTNQGIERNRLSAFTLEPPLGIIDAEHLWKQLSISITDGTLFHVVPAILEKITPKFFEIGLVVVQVIVLLPATVSVYADRRTALNDFLSAKFRSDFRKVQGGV